MDVSYCIPQTDCDDGQSCTLARHELTEGPSGWFRGKKEVSWVLHNLRTYRHAGGQFSPCSQFRATVPIHLPPPGGGPQGLGLRALGVVAEIVKDRSCLVIADGHHPKVTSVEGRAASLSKRSSCVGYCVDFASNHPPPSEARAGLAVCCLTEVVHDFQVGLE